jgi:hypothetical protein
MNAIAVSIGLFYGVISAIICYVVSMITAGLFAREFYRLYARVLIGVCSLMLVAPGLRWFANADPQLAVLCLTLSQYAVMFVLGFGVFRFNRNYMKNTFLERNRVAYFAFGTLAYAATVTLAFLHLSITGTANWAGQGLGSIGTSHYGPFLVILAAMVLHTDYHLKQSVGDLRRFSRFTFVGYAISFLGVAFSIIPYLANALSRLELVHISNPLLQHFRCAQALMIAILLYAWLVYRYESVPPLFLLLLSVIGEYHVLVTQWAVQALGPASWGIASLPLFAGIAWLDNYFANLDRRKQKAVMRQQTEHPQENRSLRFAMPFRSVEIGLATVLLCITLWTRFQEHNGSSANWLVATMVTYSCFFLVMAILRKVPALFYVSGSLTGLAALLGVEIPAGAWSVALLSGLAVTWSAIACGGERIGLKQSWRTPLTDCSLLSAILVTAIVFSRHLLGQQPYRFQAVVALDAIALGCAAFAFLVSAYQYRSRLPVFGTLVALAAIIPHWSAVVGLVAVLSAGGIRRWTKTESAIVLEDRVRLFGIQLLPYKDVMPELYVRPLSLGSVPLSLLGFLISVLHVLQGDFSLGVLVGAVISALGLGLLTLTHRRAWLYVVSLGATYFAVHAFFQGWVLATWPTMQLLSAHLLIAASVSLCGWMLATAYAAWSEALLKRVAESKEPAIRSRRLFYAGVLYDSVSVVACATLAGIVVIWLRKDGSPALLFLASGLTSLLFALATFLYRTQWISYLSLTALTLAVVNAFVILGERYLNTSVVIAGLGLVTAAIACVAWNQQFAALSSSNSSPKPWKRQIPLLESTGIGLWLLPLAVHSLICCCVALFIEGAQVQGDRLGIVFSETLPISLAMVSGSFVLCTRSFHVPLMYLAGIGLGFAAPHALLLTWQPFEAQAQSIHLLLASGLAFVSCCVALVCAYSINKQSRLCEGSRLAQFQDNRNFYAGILQHVAFATSCVALLASTWLVAFDPFLRFTDPWSLIGTSLLLTATFSFSGWIYHSRIQTYCALAAACLGLCGCVILLVPEEYRVVVQTLLMAMFGLLMGLISWMLAGRLQHESDASMLVEHRFECWEKPPFPLVSWNASRWAKPLAQFSVLLAFFSLFLALRDWVVLDKRMSVAWLSASPVYLAAAALFLATKTTPFGSPYTGEAGRAADEQKARFFLGSMVRRGCYVSSLLVFGFAIHWTVHLYLIGSLPFPLALTWHLLVSTLLVLLGWSMATLYMIRGNQYLMIRPDLVGLREELKVYGDLLQYVALFAASMALLLSIPLAYDSVPVLASQGILVVFFGLTSLTFRSQIYSYVSLLTVGLFTLRVGANVFGERPELGLFHAIAFSLEGLTSVLLASWLASGRGAPLGMDESRIQWLSPWTQPTVKTVGTLRAIWKIPLSDAAILYATLGLAMVVSRLFFKGPGQEAMSIFVLIYFSIVSTFVLAARLYNTSLLTYFGAGVISFAAIHQGLSLEAPFGKLGFVLSWVAILLWLGGFLVERYCAVRYKSDSGSSISSSLIRVYERPLIRSSSVLAVSAIVHGLLLWKFEGWEFSRIPILVSCLMAAAILMLNARSLNVMHRVSPARGLVYLACAAFASSWFGIASMIWGFNGLGPSAAIMACFLAIVGLLLIENSRAVVTSNPGLSESRLTFGEPISHSASALSVFAVAISLIALIGSQELFKMLFQISEVHGSHDLSPLTASAATLLISATVCLLSVRAQREIRWLDGVVVLIGVGLCLLIEIATSWSFGGMAVAAMLEMHAFVAMARFIRSERVRVASMLGLSEANCERPFIQWPWGLTTAVVILHSVYLANGFFGAESAGLDWTWHWTNLLCVAFYFHLLYVHPRAVYLHQMVFASMVGILGLCISSGMMVTPDVGLSALAIGWLGLSELLARSFGKRVISLLRLPLTSSQREAGQRWLLYWTIGLVLLSLVTTIPVQTVYRPGFPNVFVTVVLATLAGAIVGVQQRSVLVETAAAWLFPLGLASVMHFYGRLDALIEFGSMTLAGLSLVYYWIGRASQQRGQKYICDPFFDKFGSAIVSTSYLFSGGVVIATVVSILQSSSAIPVVAAIAMVSVSWLWMAWTSKQEVLAMAAMAGFFVAICYSGNAFFGIPFIHDPIPAFFVLAYSFLLYGVNVLSVRSEATPAKVLIRPSYLMALALPVILIAATPFDQRAVSALILLATGALYLTVARQSQIRWATYVAILLVNVAIYLWIPTASERTGLYQLYVIPAAITVLIFAHLHRQELKGKVLTSIRLAASSSILTVSTYEVFFAEGASLLQFISVLLLSLVGITLGIALQIKAFVYVGISFLVINVVGQLGVQFHRESGIIRAIILIVVGLVILAAMIFFNIHRERIMRQYRGFLVKWE